MSDIVEDRRVNAQAAARPYPTSLMVAQTVGKDGGKMRFRKKPVEIEAVQWQGSDVSWEVIKEFALEYEMVSSTAVLWRDIDDIRINTLEGVMIAKPGDWIIKGIKGELYPCKPDIFEATYEAV